ncbi:MAG: hypothetical protein MI673_08105, partial [Thiotrichales bacterium]|nr:hypothetical protein [Thiotrichales bacterium]
WASVSRVQMPEPLVSLMEFVIGTVKTGDARRHITHARKEQSGQAAGDPDLIVQQVAVLGAALAVLAEFPDQCRNSKGRISVPSIIELILEHQDTWFTDESELMSSEVMQDLISRWIKTTRPVIHG